MVGRRVIVDLVSSTTTETGLKVLRQLDPDPKGSPSPDQMAPLNLARADFHGEWNYTIKPRPNRNEAVVS